MENVLLKRKKLRISQYNYSNEGLYFITICTQNRKCILSKIVQDNISEIPQLVLSKYGEIVEKYINSINTFYKDVQIINYVIMPNHIHFVCEVKKIINNKSKNPSKMRVPMLVSTFKRFTNKESVLKIWQRDYYEHIIRNEKEYMQIAQYIQNNPYNWKKDKYYN